MVAQGSHLSTGNAQQEAGKDLTFNPKQTKFCKPNQHMETIKRLTLAAISTFFMNTALKLLALSSFVLVAPLSAQSVEEMCKVRDPNDTYVNLRYPVNGEVIGSKPNGSWIWVDPNGTVYDNQGRPWTASIKQRSSSPINREYVISKFVYGCRSGSPFSEWFIKLDTQ